MSSESHAAKKPRARASARTSSATDPARSSLGLRLVDWLLLGAFLCLTFLLGIFPLKDTDFWWHLRTGDLIRQSGRVPTTDLFTFTAADHPWIDLHWVYQVLLSWGYAQGGIVALNLAKCAITSAAVFLLVTAKRREWPVWPMLLAWLPALLVLSGRMYVRPETLSLLYLAASLAILFRWERSPALGFLLPLVQLFWVNTQGLFILGPILVTFALIDAAIRPGAFSPSRRRFWKMALPSAVLVGVACLVNPYGLTGALYPLELAGTMGNPIFAKSIAELMPVPVFIERAGWTNLPLLLHVATMLLGALSFLVPMIWAMATRSRPIVKAGGGEIEVAGKKGSKRAKAGKTAPTERETGWRLSLFRLLLFAFFSLLSWRATRNSHQFAAVVGAVTAWNFGEWAAAVRARALERDLAGAVGAGILPRVAAVFGIGAVFVWVASGGFYAMAGEGRTIGLGEQSLWYPHAAVKFAGGPEMPERFLSFHDGYAALYEYVYGPERKVFIDARLEVVGPELYERYLALQSRIIGNQSGWERSLDEIGRPAILTGNAYNCDVGSALLASPSWKCVWFDPIAAVYVHASKTEAVEAHAVDFGARHFRPELATDPQGPQALTASALALRNYVQFLTLQGQAAKAAPMVLLGLDYARRVRDIDPRGPDGWRLLGQIELFREPMPTEPVPRFRSPFDPVFDLSTARSTYALRRAVEIDPSDFSSLVLLIDSFENRAMDESVPPLLDLVVRIRPKNPEQRRGQAAKKAERDRLRLKLASPVPTTWRNLSELDQSVSTLLASGRARSAAELLERAYPREPRPWEITDRLATLYLHLGEPARARELWERATTPPSPAVRAARVGATHLVEGTFDAARQSYQAALAAEPNLFEALYGLSVLEQDDGRAAEALKQGRKAVGQAPNDVARAAAQAIVANVTPYASLDLADAPRRSAPLSRAARHPRLGW